MGGEGNTVVIGHKLKRSPHERLFLIKYKYIQGMQGVDKFNL